MLSHESHTTDERLEEIETERIDAIEEAELKAWEESKEGKEDAEYFCNVISLWYRNEEKVVTVNYDRRHRSAERSRRSPNQWEICIEDRLGFQMDNFIGTQSQVHAPCRKWSGNRNSLQPQ